MAAPGFPRTGSRLSSGDTPSPPRPSWRTIGHCSNRSCGARPRSNLRQITHLGGANFAPAWTPDGRRIIFASNAHDPRGRNFDIYLVNLDGTGLEQVTFNETFDGFPMFSPDGRKLAFGSNRNEKVEGETNVFIADWIP